MYFQDFLVSIPSNGSIQFLRDEQDEFEGGYCVSIPSNGSIQFLLTVLIGFSYWQCESQSPQTGQFNSYTLS